VLLVAVAPACRPGDGEDPFARYAPAPAQRVEAQRDPVVTREPEPVSTPTATSFPLPLPEGASVSTRTTSSITFVARSSVEATAAFYERLLADQGWKLSRMSIDEANLRMIQLEGRKRGLRTLATIRDEARATVATLELEVAAPPARKVSATSPVRKVGATSPARKVGATAPARKVNATARKLSANVPAGKVASRSRSRLASR
jgi:hypothetical protein